MEHMSDLFVGMGYEIVDGPELELEWVNFDALNIGPDNAVRGRDGHLLRRPARPGDAHPHVARPGAHAC